MAEPDTITATTPAVEDNSPAPAPAAEPTTSVSAEQPTTPVPAPDAAPAEPETPTEPVRPPRAERRIQELSAKLKEASGQPSYVPQFSQSPTAPKLSELIGNQESIDPGQLDELGNKLFQQGAQTGQGLSSLEVQALRMELAQKDAISNYSHDEEILPSRYEELNPDSPKYNPVLDETIAKVYRDKAVRSNPSQTNPNGIWVDPSVKLSDVAQDLIQLARSSAESGKAQTASNLQALADNSAVTPSSDAPLPAKPFSEMNLKEMEAHLRAQGRDV